MKKKQTRHKGKKKRACVPMDIYEDRKVIANIFDISIPKAFLVREKIYNGEVKTKKFKRKDGKEVFEIRWEL